MDKEIIHEAAYRVLVFLLHRLAYDDNVDGLA